MMIVSRIYSSILVGVTVAGLATLISCTNPSPENTTHEAVIAPVPKKTPPKSSSRVQPTEIKKKKKVKGTVEREDIAVAMVSSKQKDLQATGKKIVTKESATEAPSLSIHGSKYPLPRQWWGKRMASPAFTYDDLKMIPLELTHNRSKLFLLPDACVALQKMAEAARAEGVSLKVHSSYRSEWYQRKIFEKMLAQGRTFEDVIRYVAPPGYSEHMLGTVVDFYPSNWEYAKTPAYAWLKRNAERFNFYESYPQGQPEDMPWEAWHWRWFPSDSVGQ